MKQERIHSFSPVAGDWFQIHEFGSGNLCGRSFIERVFAWGLVEFPDGSTRVLGICGSGNAPSHGYYSGELYVQIYHVCGRDLAPDGRTWSQAYRERDTDNGLCGNGDGEFTYRFEKEPGV